MHWELAIEQDGGTISIDSFDKLPDALKALRSNDNPTAFIDLWDNTKNLNQTIGKSDLQQSVCIGQYNSLYATAEQGLQNSWMDLGIFDQLDSLSKNVPEFHDLSKKSGMSPCYFLYKKHSNYIVDHILKELNIKVKDYQ